MHRESCAHNLFTSSPVDDIRAIERAMHRSPRTPRREPGSRCRDGRSIENESPGRDEDVPRPRLPSPAAMRRGGSVTGAQLELGVTGRGHGRVRGRL